MSLVPSLLFTVGHVVAARGHAFRGGRAWQGACMAGGHAWRGGVGYAWQGVLWQGTCMVREACVTVETATAVNGMHPTGMHSCSTFFSVVPDSTPAHKTAIRCDGHDNLLCRTSLRPH